MKPPYIVVTLLLLPLVGCNEDTQPTSIEVATQRNQMLQKSNDEKNIELNKMRLEIDEIKSRHSEEIKKLNERHNHEIQQADSRCENDKKGSIGSLTEENRTIKNMYESKVSMMDEAHNKQVSALEEQLANNQLELSALKRIRAVEESIINAPREQNEISSNQFSKERTIWIVLLSFMILLLGISANFLVQCRTNRRLDLLDLLGKLRAKIAPENSTKIPAEDE